MPIDHGRTTVTPVTPQDPNKVGVGSPLAIQGIFLEVLRARFTADSGLAWIWKEDVTTTGILIEGSYNEETEARNTTPAIYVTRQQTIPAKVVIGDRGAHRLRDSREQFTALCTTSLQIECTSKDEGESAIIGDIVQFMLLASSDIIQREYGLHDLTMPELGETTPYARDANVFSTPLTIQCQYQVYWETVPIRPLLQQIVQKISVAGGDANSYFTEIAANSLSRSTRRRDSTE